MRVIARAFLILLMGMSLRGSFGLQAPAEEVVVVCPAIETDESQGLGGNAPLEPHFPIGLVVLGTAKRVPTQPGEDDLFELTVEKVLYGGNPGKTVVFRYLWQVGEERQIFALEPASFKGRAEFSLKYVLPPGEERNQMALASTRLDYHALRAERLFVGKEVSPGQERGCTVLVERMIAGPPVAPGTRVTVEIGNSMISSSDPAVHAESMIYFVSRAREGKAGQEITYEVDCRVPVEMEGDVGEALRRRESYPVRTIERDSEARSVREILFRGSVAEAIEMMGSECEASAVLAGRKLIVEKGTAKEAVGRAVDADLAMQGQEAGRFHRLRRLIQVLRAMGEGKPAGMVAQLFESQIALLGKEVLEPANVKRDPLQASWKPEMSQDDVNHGLAWLAMALDEPVADRYAERLMKARDTLAGRWKEEVSLALEASGMEDRARMKPGLERMSGRKPVVAAPGMRATGNVVAFSHDGKFMAAGTHVWNTSDWTPAGGFELDASIAGLFFSADDNVLYVAGGGPGLEIHAGYDWRTGRVVQRFTGHKAGIGWAKVSRDGQIMATEGTYEQTLCLWEMATGRLLRSFAMPEGCYSAALSPDGRTLIRQSARDRLTIELQSGVTAGEIPLNSLEINELEFTPDGKYLVITMCNIIPERIEVEVRDVTAGYRSVGTAKLDEERCTDLAISPDGRRLMVGGKDERLWQLTLPGLKETKAVIPAKAEISWGGIRRGGIAFPPDGKLIAIGSEPVRLFDARTLAPVIIGPGHGGRIENIAFSRDGRLIRTLAEDSTVCVWDAASLRVLTRSRLPDRYGAVGIRDDGKYMICAEAVRAGGKRMEQGESHLGKVVDDSGKTLCSFSWPLEQRQTTVHWLNDREAVLESESFFIRFDYLTGRNLKVVSALNSAPGFCSGILSAEDRQMLFIEGGFKAPGVKLTEVALDTGKVSRKVESEFSLLTGNRRGIIPGGNYIYLGDPGFYIYDRKTMQRIASRKFQDAALLGLAFNGDGSRYVVATGARKTLDMDMRVWDPKTQTMIRAEETVSGRILAAFPSSTRWVRGIALSPDGKRVAVVTEESGLEVWTIEP